MPFSFTKSSWIGSIVTRKCKNLDWKFRNRKVHQIQEQILWMMSMFNAKCWQWISKIATNNYSSQAFPIYQKLKSCHSHVPNPISLIT
jgi:hypothetical protein